MNKGKLRELLKEIQELVQDERPTEARITLAIAVKRYDDARILMSLDHICHLEGQLPRSLQMYRGLITERLLSTVGEISGPETREKILKSLSESADR